MSSSIRTTVGLLVLAASSLFGCVGDATEVPEPTSTTNAATPRVNDAPVSAAQAPARTGEVGESHGVAATPQLTAEATTTTDEALADDVSAKNAGVLGGSISGPPGPHPWAQPNVPDSLGATSADNSTGTPTH
jgi:hypothetical protein